MKKSNILIAAVILATTAALAYAATSGSRMLGLATPSSDSSGSTTPTNAPWWCTEKCPDGYWSPGKDKGGKTICKKQTEGGDLGTINQFTIDPKKPIQKQGMPTNGWQKTSASRTPKIINVLNPKTTSGNQNKGNGTTTGNSGKSGSDTTKEGQENKFKPPEKPQNIVNCGCDQKTFQSKMGKTFNCPTHYGELIKYKDLDGTEIVSYKTSAASCEEKWFCPEGTEVNSNELFKKCYTIPEFEKQKKIAACKGENSPEPEGYAELKEACVAFSDIIMAPSEIKKYYDAAICISEEKCQEYAKEMQYGTINEKMKTIDGKNTQDVIQACWALYDMIIQPVSPP